MKEPKPQMSVREAIACLKGLNQRNASVHITVNIRVIDPQPEEQKDFLEILGLSTKAKNVLRGLRCETAGDIMRLTIEQLNIARCCGPVTVKEILDRLKEQKITLRPE